MSFSRTLIAAAAVLLMGGITFAAPTTPKQQSAEEKANSAISKVPTHHQSGVVDSMTDTDLTLKHTYQGKTETSTFKLNPDTKKMGTVDQGSHVEVYYKTENGEHVATEVRERKSKATSSQ